MTRKNHSMKEYRHESTQQAGAGQRSGLTMDRRAFILSIATASAVAAAGIGLQGVVFDADLDDWLDQDVSRDPGPRSASDTGTLTHDRFLLLKGLFDAIGKRWEMDASGGIEQWQFASLVENKTTQAPSYLAEYTEAADLLARIRDHAGGLDQAHARLLLPSNRPESFGISRLGRARKFVSAEFILWYVSQGGFKRFGYANYRGYMGGPFSSRPLPYRGL